MGAETVPELGLLGRVDLPGVAESVSSARRYVRSVLENSGQKDTYDAELLVSELVSNAVRHSESGRVGGQVTVAVANHGDAIRIAVIDEGSATCAPRVPAEPDEDAEGGRGLWLVREVALSWGWHECASGRRRVVWFQLARR
ncbi:ATP-binding protein [Streptosporangium sp. NBC_01495]|uniref:ATP-binding protein n=1 Tax=Streptosporangium sp. NBC_01495 TaxID=2903899 RepID=UPI002E2FE4B1|nr:ATP-binding protein [Streptosporangium sp. NBC_01495]